MLARLAIRQILRGSRAGWSASERRMKCGSRVSFEWLGLMLLVVLAIAPPTKSDAQERSPAFRALYADAEPFLRSIHATAQAKIPRQRVSGITVPHHLLAADLIAHAFRIAQGER